MQTIGKRLLDKLPFYPTNDGERVSVGDVNCALYSTPVQPRVTENESEEGYSGLEVAISLFILPGSGIGDPESTPVRCQGNPSPDHHLHPLPLPGDRVERGGRLDVDNDLQKRCSSGHAQFLTHNLASIENKNYDF